ncbi:exosome complex exonuclease RRP44 isoform X1 [Trypanosoma conorhini]|uniref:Ribosomal RNA-processing protein 44 n=1 Tax=Trypanosoma conorhini TaxID=83891 RepID=A0A422NN12_9TRYP|nr:exosome complex exonuclease RRP44 isoform X1 [Trypanosoma conorhini]RNF06806.1 exosome complex exonuclease RRP44 isoform X1 [Trypanosoma conorhini]
MFARKRSAVHEVRGHTARRGGGGVTRSDIGCGVVGCSLCAAAVCGERGPCVVPTAPIIIPDTNVVLHNMNALEDARVQNIVFLSTVVSEVQNRNKAIYARLQRLLREERKQCYAFPNDHHDQTHCMMERDETPNDYNDRCIRVAARWYGRHVLLAFPASPPSVVLVSHDKLLRQAFTTAAEEGATPNLSCVTLRQFLEQAVSTGSDLLEKIQCEQPAGMKESPKAGALFQPHVAAAALEAGIHNGAYLRGKLRVSETNCFFGEIRGQWEGHNFPRVLLPGRANLNRAIHGDIVAVELLPMSLWRGPKDAKPLEDDATTEAAALAAGYTPVGRVVGITNMERRPFCGSIDVEELKRLTAAQATVSGAVSVLFQPKDNRIPRIRISTRHLEDLKDKRLSVIIDDWPEYNSFPVGHYVEVLGTIGDKDTEAKVILLENDVPHYDFSEAVYDCLPKGQWSVSTEELGRRLDLRDLCVVSVDPLGCRDIDDALHCRVVNGNHLEVGVHIADVTHFLREGTAMDEEAAKRSTSVYLVDRRINMLPQLLTENLCSIVADEDRYAFSIMWEFDENYNVVRDYFGKTVIRSRAALYYGDAQRMIDDANDTSEIAVSLRHLMNISRHFKAKREKDGALFLASQEFKFKVDNDHVNPTDMQVYQTFEANSMIEEWMLFANAAAARKVYASYPRWTLLRRHQRPAENAFDTLNEALQRTVGLQLDDTTSLTLNNSLNACIDPNDAYFNRLIRILVTRCLRQAQYFSSSEVPQDEFYHFGLAMPIYTHFTSPIRRYADVVVHRQLAAALGIMQVSEMHTDSVKMEALAGNINYRHEQAQRAGRDSQNLFTGFYLRNFADQAIPDEDGYVVKLSETHVFVLVPKYGQEGKIPKEQLLRVPDLLERVRVGIEVRRQGDVLRTTLAFSLLGMMKAGDEENEGSDVCPGAKNEEPSAADEVAGETEPVRKKPRVMKGEAKE